MRRTLPFMVPEKFRPRRAPLPAIDVPVAALPRPEDRP
jgi:hypothetical protein